MHKSPKIAKDKRMLVGVFMTSFRFCLWGVRRKRRGRWAGLPLL